MGDKGGARRRGCRGEGFIPRACLGLGRGGGRLSLSSAAGAGGSGGARDAHTCISHLVDPASSHMLSSKAKPCMSKYKGPARNCERLITTVVIHMALSLLVG